MEKVKLNLYISVDDLLEIVLLTPKDSFNDMLLKAKTGEEIYLYSEFVELVLNRSKLHLDCIDKFEEKASNPLFKQLLKKHTGSSFKLNFEDYQYLDDVDYSEVCEPNIIQFKDNAIINENRGYFTCSKANWNDKFPKLLKHTNIFINDKALNVWNEFKNTKLPSNSLIITDHYILDKKNDVKNNLEAMVDAILPSHLNTSYHISIITLDDDSLNVPAYFQKRLEKLTALRDYTIKINVYLVKKNKVHDRTILSNYWIAESGHGFDYYNEKGSIKGNHNTKLSISGINSVNYVYYEHIRLQMKSIIKDLEPVCTLNGSFKNRLLY
ncbi:hypothetical protein HNS38_11710 [Lentimicrobium sp. L6]|uniref:MIT C-terminal domain-containing protein n=1 Tax=Lentimicrobium sp. L6 TaxID=2735916 RepID=UPI001551B5F8|nr:MIT C-terminal domain-containing protein [Lentimicrobium sp. L6]NPD85432.1 hypothetical protein [Lentimicrobium sp. L6]